MATSGYNEADIYNGVLAILIVFCRRLLEPG
jgi:hypothetical protein